MLNFLELICEELSAQALYLFSTISTGVPSSEPVKLSNARNFWILYLPEIKHHWYRLSFEIINHSKVIG